MRWLPGAGFAAVFDLLVAGIVRDKPAAVLKATGPDGKHFTLYFDKDGGLPVKEVAKMFDLRGNEYVMEASFTDYKDFGGIKKATKIEVKRDGEISQVMEVTDFQVLDNLDPETFSQPK